MFVLEPILELADAPTCAPTLVAIFSENRRFVSRALMQLGVGGIDLEDALQDVFLVVHRRLHDYREQQKLKSWLYSICKRVARGFRRKRERAREQLTAWPPEAVAETCQLENIAAREALELVLREIPEPQRSIFLLYEVEELPMSVIASALNCPLQTGYSRLRKARERVLFVLTQSQQQLG